VNIPYGNVKLGVAMRGHDEEGYVIPTSKIVGYKKLKPNDRAAVDEWFTKVNKDY
jgi:hypothetical protein